MTSNNYVHVAKREKMKMVVVEIVGDMSITAAHQPLSVVTNKTSQDTVKLPYTLLGVCMIFGGYDTI